MFDPNISLYYNYMFNICQDSPTILESWYTGSEWIWDFSFALGLEHILDIFPSFENGGLQEEYDYFFPIGIKGSSRVLMVSLATQKLLDLFSTQWRRFASYVKLPLIQCCSSNFHSVSFLQSGIPFLLRFDISIGAPCGKHYSPSHWLSTFQG